MKQCFIFLTLIIHPIYEIVNIIINWIIMLGKNHHSLKKIASAFEYQSIALVNAEAKIYILT